MENIRKYMKIGIVHSMAFPAAVKDEQSLIDSVRCITKDDFFDVIEIGHIQKPETRERLRNLIEIGRLAVSFAGHSLLLSQALNINDLCAKGRNKAIEALKQGIDEAYEMNAESFAFLSGRYEEQSKEDALQALIQSTRELCEYAAAKGDIPVLVEVFDYNIDKKSLIGPVELVERFAREMARDCANFGLMVDLSHLPLLGETPTQSLLPIRQYIKHVHIGNAVVKAKSLEAYGDEHPRFGFPHSENDVEEVAEFLRVLLAIGYLNTFKPPIVSFEIKPRPYEEPEVVIAGAKRVLKEAWSKVL